jgi:hypothetical protein
MTGFFGSMLTITTPATDLKLLTAAELRAAIGVTNGNQDTALAVIETRVAASIARVCRVPQGGVRVPTLRSETLTEVFRLNASVCELRLSRRPIVSITSVVEDGTALDADDYETDDAAGLLRRLDGNDSPSRWASAKITVVYVAGWATVPDDLKLAAAKYVNALYQAGTRDANLRHEEIPGVRTVDYWVPDSGEPAIPPEVIDILSAGGYLNYWA